jgi:putative intracellular protease/amidase
MMRRSEILMFDGLDVVAPFEILVSAGYHVELVTLEQDGAVTAAHGMTLNPNGILGSRPDLLIVPGGGWASKAPASAWGEVHRDAALAEAARIEHDFRGTVLRTGE